MNFAKGRRQETAAGNFSAELPAYWGHVALGYQMNVQLGTLMVGSNCAANVMWVSGSGKWDRPSRVTPANFAKHGGIIATAQQTSLNSLNAMFIRKDGAVNVMWVPDEGS